MLILPIVASVDKPSIILVVFTAMSKTAVLPKSIAVLIALALALTLSYPVFAQITATPTDVTRKEKIQEKMATREAALKTRLAAFKDKEKAQVVETINKNLNSINQKITAQLLKHLQKMTSILTKLEARVNSAKPDVKDVAAAREAIADARAAIDTATLAVGAQAEIDYTIKISAETRAKTDVQKVREKLHNDLVALRQLVIEAKQAVAEAIRVAKSGPSSVKEGTPSGR